MTAIYIICFIAATVGIFFVFGLTPKQINSDVSALFEKRENLRDLSLRSRGKKRKSRVISELEKIKRALTDTGKGAHFGIACAVSLVLIVAGCVLAMAMDNPFLIPVFAIAFALIPFAYLKRTIRVYDTQLKDELETALSIITTSYIRCENIVTAVEENIGDIKPPVRGIFETFLTETTVISPDIVGAIYHLREKVRNTVFEEWCDTLILCQSDRTLKDTLMQVVSKLTDIRLVNSSLKTMISENRREYYVMVCMVLGNIPLLRLINKDWYDALMYSTVGKLVLAICGAVVLFTLIRMLKITRPIEYKR